MTSKTKNILGDIKDPFSGIGTSLVALTLFYTLLFQASNLKVDTLPFWQHSLFFILLLITFAFTMFIFRISQKGDEFLRAGGVLLFIFWWIVYFYFYKSTLNMVSYFSSSLSQFIDFSMAFGLAWLIIVPSLIIPVIGVYFSLNYFKLIKNDFKRVKSYWVFSILISLFSFLDIRFSQKSIGFLAKILTILPDGWLSVLAIGIFTGIMVMFVIAPIYPLFSEIIKFFFNVIESMASYTKNKPFKRS